MNVGDKVKVTKCFQPWQGHFRKKVGVIIERRQVAPSKRVRDGLIWYVKFNMMNRKTGEIGLVGHFLTKEIILIDNEVI